MAKKAPRNPQIYYNPSSNTNVHYPSPTIHQIHSHITKAAAHLIYEKYWKAIKPVMLIVNPLMNSKFNHIPSSLMVPFPQIPMNRFPNSSPILSHSSLPHSNLLDLQQFLFNLTTLHSKF